MNTIRYTTPTIAFAFIIGTSAAAEPVWNLSDVHLDIIPRTQSETDRIAKVTTPTNGFDAPEKFEDRPAGKCDCQGTGQRGCVFTIIRQHGLWPGAGFQGR